MCVRQQVRFLSCSQCRLIAIFNPGGESALPLLIERVVLNSIQK
jgi:hypothetical protein